MLDKIYENEHLKEKLHSLKNNIPTVIVLCGPKGVGKKHVAYNFIDEIYKGVYSSKLKSLLDIKYFEPDTKVFKLSLIDKIKESFLNTPFELNEKYYILKNADLMNKESANSCLKMFEDSPSFNHFILLVENENSLLPTIRSRSIILKVRPVTNLRKYIPEITRIEEKIVDGCPGLLKHYADIDLDLLYKSCYYLLNNYESLSYSEILNWFSDNINLDFALLNNMMMMVSIDILQERSNYNPSYYYMEQGKILKDKLRLNLNMKIHFKQALIRVKNLL